jgi:2-C-methyl-D-erythritol 4-phosphate cytidylyltransferase
VLPGAAVVVTVRPEDAGRARALLPRVLVVGGGASRQASVLAGLRALPAGIEHVLVHDAARPLVTEAVVRRTLEAVRTHGAAVAGLPVGDSLHVLGATPAGGLARSLDREGLFAAQTPQGARRSWLLDALERAEREGREGTDEAALLLAAGHPVVPVEGDPHNLKLTHAADLALAEAILSRRESERPLRP